MATSFKVELAKAVHNFTQTTGHVFKMALYDNTVSFTRCDHRVHRDRRAADRHRIHRGRLRLDGCAERHAHVDRHHGVLVVDGQPELDDCDVHRVRRDDLQQLGVEQERGVLDFGGAKPVSSGTFTVVLPTNDATNAILRIA
jgi:hypothetical protein